MSGPYRGEIMHQCPIKPFDFKKHALSSCRAFQAISAAIAYSTLVAAGTST